MSLFRRGCKQIKAASSLQPRQNSLIRSLVAVLSVAGLALPVVLSAERIRAQEASEQPRSSRSISFTLGPLIRSLRISSLQAFVADGTVAKDLAFFFSLASVKPEDYPRIRKALVESPDIKNPLVISRVLNTSMGESVLQNLGVGFTLLRGGNGALAIRAALVNAAQSAEGPSVLSVFANLPANVQIRLEEALRVAREGERVVEGTKLLVETLEKLSNQEAFRQPTVDFSTLPNPRDKGPYSYSTEEWNITDSERARKLRVLVYKPQQTDLKKMPVVVFSHGLGSNPDDFEEGFKHLASYGYLVAAPQHPGSDDQWTKDLLRGLRREVFDIQEFKDRPADLTFVLDELERRNADTFGGRLQLDRVAVTGHSFGGYTALALAGATINKPFLEEECEIPYGVLNVAVLLECEALRLNAMPSGLQDPRVASVFVLNPVNRSIFGEEGLSEITVPVAFVSGSYDPATPPALEQADSFTWLTTPNRYWYMVEGQAHVNLTKVDPGIRDTLNSIEGLTLPSQNLISDYWRGAVIPFLDTTIRGGTTFAPHLSPAFTKYMSEGKQFSVFMITDESDDDLESVIRSFRGS
jgi:predicted dienelactone hydrolase